MLVYLKAVCGTIKFYSISILSTLKRKKETNIKLLKVLKHANANVFIPVQDLKK